MNVQQNSKIMKLDDLPEELFTLIFQFLLQKEKTTYTNNKFIDNKNQNYISISLISTILSLKHVNSILWNKIHFNSSFWKHFELDYNDFVCLYFKDNLNRISNSICKEYLFLKFIEFSKALCDVSNLIKKVKIPFYILLNELFVVNFNSVSVIKVDSFNNIEKEEVYNNKLIKFNNLKELYYSKTLNEQLDVFVKSHVNQLEKIVILDDFNKLMEVINSCNKDILKEINLRYYILDKDAFIRNILNNNELNYTKITSLRIRSDLNTLQSNNWKELCYNLKKLKYLCLFVHEDITFIGLDQFCNKNNNTINNFVEISLQLNEFLISSKNLNKINIHESLNLLTNLERIGFRECKVYTNQKIVFFNLKELIITESEINLNNWVHEESNLEILTIFSKTVQLNQIIKIQKQKRQLKYLSIDLQQLNYLKIIIEDCPLKVNLLNIKCPIEIKGKNTVHSIIIEKFYKTVNNYSILINLDKICNEIIIIESLLDPTASLFFKYKFKYFSGNLDYLKLENNNIYKLIIGFYSGFKINNYSYLLKTLQNLNIKNIKILYCDVRDDFYTSNYTLKLNEQEFKEILDGCELFDFYNSWRKELAPKCFFESIYLKACSLSNSKNLINYVEVNNCNNLQKLSLFDINTIQLFNNSLQNITELCLQNFNLLKLDNQNNFLNLNSLTQLQTLILFGCEQFTILFTKPHFKLKYFSIKKINELNGEFLMDTPNLKFLEIENVKQINGKFILLNVPKVKTKNLQINFTI